MQQFITVLFNIKICEAESFLFKNGNYKLPYFIRFSTYNTKRKILTQEKHKYTHLRKFFEWFKIMQYIM